MDPREFEPKAILRRIDFELGEMRRRRFDVFVREDRKGAKHNLTYTSPTPSIINSAALLELVTEDESFISGDLLPFVKSWREDLLLQTLTPHLKNLSSDRSRDSYDAAYDLGQRQRAVRDPTIEKALRNWLSNAIEQWSLRKRHIAPSVFLAHLADPPRNGDLAQRCLALSEYVISRQVAAALSDDWPDFNAIDLVLAVSLVQPSTISPTLLGTAIKILNQVAEKEQIWKNHPTGTVSGSSKGCSALFACTQLMCRGEESVVARLGPALESHLTWVISSRIEDCWRGSDLPERAPTPETWFNCVCARFLSGMRRFVADGLERKLRYIYREQPSGEFMSLEQIVIKQPIKESIEHAFILPVRQKTPRNHFSAILHGPPGTAKTTIAQAIAHDVGWPLIELGVADFLSRGLEGVFSRATEIFEDLLQLTSVVILLDEVEQVFRNRDDEADLRQKFLTSALLPPLKRLRDKQSVIFLIATNFISDFDDAAKRLGRIDLLLPIGPPDQEEREALLRALLKYENERARDVARMLPAGVTIGEILAIKRIPHHQELNPEDLVVAWNELFPAGPSLSPRHLTGFARDAREYYRLR